jgi:signal transduction histidine kinase
VAASQETSRQRRSHKHGSGCALPPQRWRESLVRGGRSGDAGARRAGDEAAARALERDDATLLVVFCSDSFDLKELLDNLISNAIKFTPVGGRVEVRLSAEDGRLLVDVINTGSFIPPDERDRTFDRFYRAQSTGKQVVPGIGLGLAISKAIVEAHHGEIRADSDEDAGTTFRVVLPTNAELPEPAGARAARAVASG